MHRRRTNSVSGKFSPAIKTCLNAGTVRAASSPRHCPSVGTSRCPIRRHPAFSTASPSFCRQKSAAFESRGRKSCPTAYSPVFGRLYGRTFRKKASGICSISPAPSLVFRSAPMAQRCSRFFRIVTPFSTRACDGQPSSRTIKPIPQLSCSNEGAQSPNGNGSPAALQANPLIIMGVFTDIEKS